MGEVYLAEDTRLRRRVAIKVLPVEFTSDPERLARLEREAQILAQLEHPNVAAVYGLEEAEGVCFVAMQLAEGPTLAERIARGPIPLDEALPIALQIARGLEAAHEKGIVHRDLKPANVMLCPQPDGSVVAKVLDFGLAMLVDADTRLTKTGTAPGTVGYMTPEQLIGETADAATDVYGLGVIMYEMLTGRAAFRGGNQTEIALAVMHGDPPAAISSLLPDVPEPVSALIAQMMLRDRKKRPQTAREIVKRAAEIEKKLGLPDVTVKHVGPAEKPRAAWGLRPAVR
jgi:serine/threonine-protein kinase